MPQKIHLTLNPDRFSYRLDRNRNMGGFMIFIRDDIPSRMLTKHVFPDDIEGLFIEVYLFIFGTYHPPTQSDSYYFNNLDKALDLYSHYDKKLLVGDFNTEVSDVLSTFLYQHDLENLVKEKTCFKNANNPSTIDLFLTNNSLAFQNTTATFTSLSDCHNLVLTVLKTTFSRNKPKEILYRDYKKFTFSDFNDELKTIFSKNTVGSCYQFDRIFPNVLDKHAPMKRKIFAANCIKKKGNGFLIVLIRLLLLTINYAVKRLNHSFQTREITDHKLNSLKKMRYCKTMI